jgi:hypothetical protein
MREKLTLCQTSTDAAPSEPLPRGLLLAGYCPPGERRAPREAPPSMAEVFAPDRSRRTRLEGKTFGHLHVKRFLGAREWGHAFWEVVCRAPRPDGCECGNRLELSTRVLMGRRDCGCQPRVREPAPGYGVTYQGRTQSIRAWARELGLTPDALRMRLRKGWDLERAMKTPHRPTSARPRRAA